MTKTAGSSDLRPRTRRKKTEIQKVESRKEKEKRKRKLEAELREKNKAKGPLFPAAPARRNEPDADQPEPLDMRDGSDDDDDDEVDSNLYVDIAEPGLLPSNTRSVQEYNITADLDIEGDDNFEDAEEEVNEENDINSVMGLYLLAIQKRIRKEISDKNMSSQDKWLHKLLKDDEYLIEVKRAKLICKKLLLHFSERYYYSLVSVE